MSKTTFEPKVKGITYGAVEAESKETASKEEFKNGDAYQEFGASKWKGMGMSTSTIPGASNDIMDLLITKPAVGAYLDHFAEVELPPDVMTAKELFPASKEDLKDAIEESLVYYKDYLALYDDRRDNALKTLSSGKSSPEDSRILQEFVSKLNDAEYKVRDQIRILKEFKKEKGI